VPLKVRSFLTRATIIFIVWKLVYGLALAPVRFPDKPLTRLTGASATFLYKHLLGEQVVLYKDEVNKGFNTSAVYINNRRAITIGDGCNGMELYVLFIAFLFCIPSTLKRQIAFSLAGIGVIFICNGLRCFGLAWMFLNNYYNWIDFAHHYLFKVIIYGIMFYGWVLYVKKSLWYGA
jgi:exosortase/archaeosortase family protein